MIAQNEATNHVEPPQTETFASFSDRFKKECIEGSGIHPALYKAAIEIVADVEQLSGGDAYLPIHEALGWRQDRFVRFGQQCKIGNYAAFFKNEDERVWQAKLATPRVLEGEEIKYETPTREISGGARGFFPEIPSVIREKIEERWGIPVPRKGSFWAWALTQRLIPIFLAEGGKKALKLLSEGCIAIGLNGCHGAATVKDELGRSIPPKLIKEVELFANSERKFYLVFDQDEKPSTRATVRNALGRLTALLIEKGCSVRELHWEPSDGKGIDDFLVGGGKLDRLLETSKPGRVEGQSKNQKLLRFFESEFGQRLRLNEMTLRVERDGEPIDLGGFFLDLAEDYDLDISELKAGKIAWRLASRNSYSPVREYLDKLPLADPAILDGLAAKYLGADDPFFGKLLRRTLIAAVARAFQPGCKHDGVCILHGHQGAKKSAFWETLAGTDFFTDSFGEKAGDRDEKMKLRRYWLLESPEFENMFLNKEVSQIKAFITTKIDSLRLPYGRELGDFPRSSILVGSTNKPEFLRDATGERRFWVIPVKGRINLAELEAQRDEIWGAAIAAYRSKDEECSKWWLEPDEEFELGQKIAQFKVADPWESEIDRICQGLNSISISELLEKLGIELKLQDRRISARASDILRGLGWEPYKGAKGKRLWKAPIIQNNFSEENTATHATQELEPLSEGRLPGGGAGGVGVAFPSTAATHEEERVALGGILQNRMPPSESLTPQAIQAEVAGGGEFPCKKNKSTISEIPAVDVEAIAQIFTSLHESGNLTKEELTSFNDSLSPEDRKAVYATCPQEVKEEIDRLRPRKLLPVGTIVRHREGGWLYKVVQHFPSDEAFKPLGPKGSYGPLYPFEYEVIPPESLIRVGGTCRLKPELWEKQVESVAKTGGYFDPKWLFWVMGVDNRFVTCDRSGSGKGKRRWTFSHDSIEMIQIPPKV
jgi:Virulence-associated protein E/Domain of unknown function (DUF3854)